MKQEVQMRVERLHALALTLDKRLAEWEEAGRRVVEMAQAIDAELYVTEDGPPKYPKDARTYAYEMAEQLRREIGVTVVHEITDREMTA
jgi:hypothetical protein